MEARVEQTEEGIGEQVADGQIVSWLAECSKKTGEENVEAAECSSTDSAVAADSRACE